MLFDFIPRTRSLIVREKDVITALTVINTNSKTLAARCGNCGWGGENQRDMWFIMFESSNKNYGTIVRKLNKIGTVSTDVRPGGMVDLLFEKEPK